MKRPICFVVLFALFCSCGVHAITMNSSQYRLTTTAVISGGTKEASTVPGVSIEAFFFAGQPNTIGTSDSSGSSGDFRLQSGYAYTLWTSGEVANITGIYNIRVNGITLANGDVFGPGKINQASIEVTNTDPTRDVITCEMYLDGTRIPLDGPISGLVRPFWGGPFASPSAPPNVHYLTFYASNEIGESGIVTYEVRVFGGSVQVVGVAMNYPNPFRPLGGASDSSTNIHYTLSGDTPVIIIMYDITGKEVKRFNFSAGQNGGRAGTNAVSWNGKSMFGQVVGNGMYLYRIIAGGKVLASGKLVVLD